MFPDRLSEFHAICAFLRYFYRNILKMDLLDKMAPLTEMHLLFAVSRLAGFSGDKSIVASLVDQVD